VTLLTDHLQHKLAVLCPQQNGQFMCLRFACLGFSAVWWRKQGESSRRGNHWCKVE